MTKTQIIIILIAIALLALVVGVFTYMRNEGLKDLEKDDDSETLSADQLHVETVNSDFVILSAGEPVTRSGNVIEQTLTATVYPATATNKAVDWSVSWGDPNNSTDVTDFITVTPESNGSNVATVACHKPFDGTIIITVTTRESGYTAECIVTYTGKPTEMTVTSSAVERADGYHLGAGQAYTFNYAVTNVFGEVNPSYNNYKVELGAVGSVVLGYKEESTSSGNINWYDNLNQTVTLDSLKDKFLSVTYADGAVTVNTIKTVESYYESMERIDSGRTRAYHNAFRSYASPSYFTVTITEQNSGFSKTLNIYIDDTVVTGVDLVATEMSF